MSVEQMRALLLERYQNSKRIASMTDSQIIAVYHRVFLNK